MIVSRNEIESLALKAARGAGMSWGIAEEASLSAGWLAGHGMTWAETLTSVLRQARTTSPPHISGNVVAPSCADALLCPIMTGALLSDLGSKTGIDEVRDVLEPLWLLPSLARWVTPDCAVIVTWGQSRIQLSVGGVLGASVASEGTKLASRVTISMEPIDRSEPRALVASSTGYVVRDVDWRELKDFESKTYVPASEHSRRTGAGAGLRDTD